MDFSDHWVPHVNMKTGERVEIRIRGWRITNTESQIVISRYEGNCSADRHWRVIHRGTGAVITSMKTRDAAASFSQEWWEVLPGEAKEKFRTAETVEEVRAMIASVPESMKKWAESCWKKHIPYEAKND